jgi:trehalose/maltose hydrolase-like predicted phosphorylase
MRTGPISPPPVRGGGRFELPAYVSNGFVGLRIPDVPLLGGYALVNGFTGEHPEKKIEAAALVPFPLGGNLCINGVSLDDATHCIGDIEQAYDFASGELTTRFSFSAGGARADVEVLIFCSRDEPALACQQVEIVVDHACSLIISGGILTGGVSGETVGVGGEPRRFYKDLPGKSGPIDGALRWAGPGNMSTCGLAYVTKLDTEVEAQRSLDANSAVLNTSYLFQAEPGRRYRSTQITALLPGVLHRQPELQAARLAAMNAERGFSEVRARNRAEWDELWKSRIVLVGADPRWQAMTDAAFFYLNTSVHSSSHASTSIFGLATWKNYHYYYGHVMWDIETFLVPVLSLVQPHAAAALLEYRYRSRTGASNNACTRGLRGLQFPWESAPSTGDEAAPLPGTAAWHEDHVSLDVALAFARHALITGDRDFMRRRAWPIVSGVANWLESRVLVTSRGYEIHETTGIAEREKPTNNAAFMNMSAKRVLRAAIEIGTAVEEPVKPIWNEIAEKLVVPERDDAIISYDAYSDDDDKGETPDPLMALFPLGCQLSPTTEQATLALYLPKAKDYIGSPMLSAFYGVWAAWSGDRALASELLDEGYAAFLHDRFMQTLEYRHDRFPEQPIAGPFFANLGGFIMALLFGFPALIPDAGEPKEWGCRPVNLPAQWDAIEVERVWIRGKPTRLTARQGAQNAVLDIGAE